jgi:hypothetical protein
MPRRCLTNWRHEPQSNGTDSIAGRFRFCAYVECRGTVNTCERTSGLAPLTPPHPEGTQLTRDAGGGRDHEVDDLFRRADQAISESHLLRCEQRLQRKKLRQTVSKLRTEIDAIRREQQLARGLRRCEISISA